MPAIELYFYCPLAAEETNHSSETKAHVNRPYSRPYIMPYSFLQSQFEGKEIA